MAETTLTDQQINKLVQDAQQAAQDTQQVVQSLQQALSNAGVFQRDSGTSNVGLNRFTDDTSIDESHKLTAYVNANAWAFNTKALIEKSQDHDRSLKALEVAKGQLELQRAQHDFAQKQKLDHYENMRSLAGLNYNCDLDTRD